jgi:hypothetical protein
VMKNMQNSQIPLQLIGHSHYNGKNGDITSDLSTITTARDITESIRVTLIN